jgi:hypothetical protein
MQSNTPMLSLVENPSQWLLELHEIKGHPSKIQCSFSVTTVAAILFRGCPTMSLEFAIVVALWDGWTHEFLRSISTIQGPIRLIHMDTVSTFGLIIHLATTVPLF